MSAAEKDFHIREIRIHDMRTPLGLDATEPVFSWILEGGGRDVFQNAARICVGTEMGTPDMWDSGLLETNRSNGIAYGGRPLQPRTRYFVSVRVRSNTGGEAEAETWFETGLLNPRQSAWDGARFIGAPEYAIAADTISVFVLESTIVIEKGGRAGLVFGADDPRLLDPYKNEMLLEGENFIRYVLNFGTVPAELEIWRVGYAADDRADRPLFCVPLRDPETGQDLISSENAHLPHTLRLEVVGNGAYTWLDGHLIDADLQKNLSGSRRMPRCLNPLGIRDVTTYPRLNSIGYYVGAGSRASYPEGIQIRNLRQPGSLIGCLDSGGKTLDGERQEVQDPSCHSLPMLRREFSVSKKLARARLYCTARGIYACRLNGRRVGDEFFAPGASQFDRHLVYQTYDVTGDIRPGKNAVGCILASGWWSDSFSFVLDNYNFWGDRPSFLAKLVLSYEDGTEDVIVSEPETWEYFGEGPYRYAGFFNGEHFDARYASLCSSVFLPGFTAPEIRRPAVITPLSIPEKEGLFPGAAVWPAVNAQEPELVGHFQAPVRIAETLTARSVSEPRKGVFIYDLGQEIAGVPLLRFHEKRGRRIVIRYGEMLYPDLPQYGELSGLMLQANLREASNTDIYICSGEGTEVYQPEFTFRGYRYIEITGAENPPAISEVQSLLLSSVPEMTGKFHCSSELVNRFVSNVRYSQLSNFISIPTDCPQRNERMGWLGDTHIFCRTATYQAPVRNFYLRNLQAMRDMQTPDGRLPSIAPFGGGFGGMTYESAMILIVWELYQQYGDDAVIREYFSAMDAWMDAAARCGLPGRPQLRPMEWLGDWLAPDPTDEYLIFNAFHYRNAAYMARFADILGLRDAFEKYRDIAERTKQYWNDVYLEPESGMTRNTDGSLCDVQGSYAIALSCGVIAEEYERKAYEHLARKTLESGCKIRTGFFGTGALNPMLSAGGYPELAGRAITQTEYPSWLYSVTQGATTVWERWDSFTEEKGFGDNNAMNSFDHYSLGSVVSWLYENVLGIQRDERKPGYQHFTLKPEIGTFSYAEGGIDTPYGRIDSGWRLRDGNVVYQCGIPVNTTAELILGEERISLGSGRYEFIVPESSLQR